MPHSKQLHMWMVVGLIHLLSLGATAEDELRSNTIVVHTPLQNYDQPTLRDYEECQANRDTCIEVCDGAQNCEDECPVCPELYDRPLMVQGVNDTEIVAPPQVPINTTNIIRLTNEINNIIEHQIKNHNEVNIKVEQNVTQVGGRFGLGYSDKGPCCYVVRLNRECEQEGGHDCQERSRQRVCGEKCQARVMLAKLVIQCDADDSDKCHETIEYVPRRRRSHSRKSTKQTQCQYFGNNWPYFTCGQNPGQNGDVAQPSRVKRSTCQQCLNYPYGYVLQNGLPAQCAGCFQGYGMPMYNAPWMYNPYMPYPQFGSYPGINNGNNNGNNNENTYENVIANSNIAGSGEGEEWILCDDDNIENCLNEKKSKDSQKAIIVQRRRRRHNRQNFERSAYSKRNLKN